MALTQTTVVAMYKKPFGFYILQSPESDSHELWDDDKNVEACQATQGMKKERARFSKN
jgi:hypothetical protein